MNKRKMDKQFKQELNVEVISPMFSCGNKVEFGENEFGKKVKKGIPEIRTAELKGLMRYIYRVASTEKSRHSLLKKEGAIFGKSEEMASPIRMQIRGNIDYLREDYLRYKNKGTNNKKDTKNKSIAIGTTFTITLRCFQKNTFYTLENYRDLLELSLMLGGIGKRARRGRGCMASHFAKSKNIVELKEWITSQLNFINRDSSDVGKIEDTCQYILSDNTIYGPKCFQDQCYKRPVIEKIVFGNDLREQYKNAAGEQVIKSFLQTVDNASHLIKKEKEKQLKLEKGEIIYATGHISDKQAGRHNFSSSVIVTLVETKDGIYPVYIFLKAVYNLAVIDDYKREQDEFARLINPKGDGV